MVILLHDNKVLSFEYVLLYLIATCISMCALHCYVCQDQHLVTNLQETSSIHLRQAFTQTYALHVCVCVCVCVCARTTSSRVKPINAIQITE